MRSFFLGIVIGLLGLLSQGAAEEDVLLSSNSQTIPQRLTQVKLAWEEKKTPLPTLIHQQKQKSRPFWEIFCACWGPVKAVKEKKTQHSANKYRRKIVPLHDGHANHQDAEESNTTITTRDVSIGSSMDFPVIPVSEIGDLSRTEEGTEQVAGTQSSNEVAKSLAALRSIKLSAFAEHGYTEKHVKRQKEKSMFFMYANPSIHHKQSKKLLEFANKKGLDLSYWGLGGLEWLEKIRDWVPYRREEKYLTLYRFSISAPKLVSLSYLDLSHNYLGISDAAPTLSSLGILKNLVRLRLTSNHLDDQNALDLGLSLKEMPRLKYLYLGSNSFTGEGVKVITRSLEQNSPLSYLDVNYNALGCKGDLKALAEGTSSLLNLQRLNLKGNYLGGGKPSYSGFLDVLRALPLLEAVDLSLNGLTANELNLSRTLLTAGLLEQEESN